MLVTTGKKKPVHVCRHSEGLVTLETCGRSDEGHDHFQIFGNFSDFGKKYPDLRRFFGISETYHISGNISYFLETFQTFGKY